MRSNRYEPWTLLNQLSNEINRLYENADQAEGGLAAGDWVPAVDIREEQDRYVLHADVPGVDPNDIDLHMENGILSIRGERRTQPNEQTESFRRTERVQGSFFRRFSLPDTADADRISASCKHGVLEVVIPKQKKGQPRRIKVEG